jgi:hypothetical protein
VFVLVFLMSAPTGWRVGSEFAVDLSGLTATVLALAPQRGQPRHRSVGYTGQDTSLAGDPSQAPAPSQQDPTGTLPRCDERMAVWHDWTTPDRRATPGSS